MRKAGTSTIRVSTRTMRTSGPRKGQNSKKKLFVKPKSLIHRKKARIQLTSTYKRKYTRSEARQLDSTTSSTSTIRPTRPKSRIRKSSPVEPTQEPLTLVDVQPHSPSSSNKSASNTLNGYPATTKPICSESDLRRNYMKPMRKKKRSNTLKNGLPDCTDLERHEAFVKSFAIPTHLYRYLSQRHRHRPLFLDRTLSYLKPSPPSLDEKSPHTKFKRTRSIHTVAERLFQEQQQKLRLMGSRSTKAIENSPNSLIKDLRSPSSVYWPQEIQLSFEGFFDSVKELDWITVEASVELQLRFGCAWRQKPCPGDMVVTPFSSAFPLICYNPLSGLEHTPPATNSVTTCIFRPAELFERAKWSSVGRLNSAQLELRINAVERRWLKRPDSSRLPSNGEEPTYRPVSASSHRKAGLSSSSYPVHYTTAPLPLFYPSNISSNLSEPRPLLLSPGLYELRLGVDHDDNNVTVIQTSKPLIKRPVLCNGFRDDSSNAHSAVSDSSDLTSINYANDGVSINDAGTVTNGRVEWQRIRFPNSSEVVDEYSRWPRIRFHVTWHGRTSESSIEVGPNADVRKPDSLNGVVETRVSSLRNGTPQSPPRSSPKSVLTRCLTDPLKSLSPKDARDHARDAVTTPPATSQPTGFKKVPCRAQSVSTPVVSRRITYRFLFMGQLRQWSESSDLVCPWCQLDCVRAREKGPDALLVHLRTCHPRFRFKASWNQSKTHLSLEVSLNEAYDGSNDCGLRRWSCGNFTSQRLVPPGQLIGGWTGLGLDTQPDDGSSPWNMLPSHASRVPYPMRRLPYTHLIFWRGADQCTVQPLDPTLSVRPLAVGHNRVYYHTQAVQPIRTCEWDLDSESEDNPNWLRQHYQRKVEEFSDVNSGEKQLMQLWNDLLLSIRPSDLVVCDVQILNLCFYFVHHYASAIHHRQLRNNLLLHFANLVDYGLISPKQMRQLIATYDSSLPTSPPRQNGESG